MSCLVLLAHHFATASEAPEAADQVKRSAMHAPLERPHPDCQEVISNLYQCHEENPRMKFFGACNEAKLALDKCFKKEKERKRDENLKRARASDAYVRQKMQERRERAAEQATADKQ